MNGTRGQYLINGVEHVKRSGLHGGQWQCGCSCGWRGHARGRPDVVSAEWRQHVMTATRHTVRP